MTALQGSFGYSFLLGVFAAVNPCGFVLLPTYLTYFLGIDGQHRINRRASVERALVVSAAMSAGFISVFLAVGTVARSFVSTIDNAKYASLGVGIALLIAGASMLCGWKPPFSSAGLGSNRQRTRTFWSMVLFGAAYAVASIGCTIGFLVSAVFGSFGSSGVISGVLSVAMYGAGMALLVTALTVTLAFSSGVLTKQLRRGLRHMDRVSAFFVLLTGAYLTWYWYSSIAGRNSDPVVGKVDEWQSWVVDHLQRAGTWPLAGVLATTTVIGVVFVRSRRRSDAPQDERVDDAPRVLGSAGRRGPDNRRSVQP